MTEISCDVCLDLLPLVQDHIASEDSRTLVADHLAHCERCRMAANQLLPKSQLPNDKAVLRSLRRQIGKWILLFLTVGALFGIFLTNSAGMFYNFALMPLAGMVGFFALPKDKWFVLPMTVFGLSFLSTLFLNWSEGVFSFGGALIYSVIYTALAVLGVLVSTLFSYAFRKEKKS